MAALQHGKPRPLVVVVAMIFGITRIKNEQRWIARVVQAQLTAVDKLLVFDDHSTDETRHICRSFRNVEVFESPFEGINEARDKNFLMERLEEQASPGDWVTSIDGDEELAPGSADVIRRIVAEDGGADTYRFKVLYLWNRPNQIRTDGIYADFRRPSFFRFRRGARFNHWCGGGFHCGNVPEPNVIRSAPVHLLHYGYMSKDDRIRKYHWYNADDKQPVPKLEDGYRHMVIGDLFPENSQFKHAGPLKLEPLEIAVACR